MKQKGMLLTCDRCGVTHLCEFTGQGEADGGYTRWDKFEYAPDWKHTYCKTEENKSTHIDLCPECSKWYEKLEREFEAKVRAEIIIEEKKG